MQPLDVVLRIYQSNDPPGAFRAMVDAVAAALPLRCAVYLHATDRSIRDAWPAQVELTEDLLDTALHILRPEVFPLGSEFPFDSGRFPQSDLLLLPLHRNGERPAICLLIADSDAFGEDMQPWQQVAEALERFEQRHHKLLEAESRCEELQRRVSESEALHTLGLAANRTLDADEVLNLVARFTRTLLAAHYVTVSTVDSDRIYTVASVGLRNAEDAEDDYHLARAVVEAEKPITIGGTDANLQVESFPYHAREGMRAGLGIPLSLFGDTFGALVVGYRSGHTVSPRDIRLAITLAGHAAVAISNARLHERVEQRSEDLTRAYEQLSDLTEAKERFFASINHELRNPIGAIMGYQTLLLDGTAGELPEGARNFLGKAQRAAETLLTLVNDLLDLSKIAAGKMELQPRECTVAEILEGVLNTIQPLADAKGVPLRVAALADAPPLRTDAHRVQQILVNLLSNAVKFTEQGEVRVEVETVGEPEGGVEIRVVDSGPGIPPDDLKRVFEEYEQVKGTRGGTGLGLPISRRLARLLGGDLFAQSEVGVGSTFVLRLPIAEPGVTVEAGSDTVAEAFQS